MAEIVWDDDGGDVQWDDAPAPQATQRNATPDSALTRRLRGVAQTTIAPAAQLMSRAGQYVGNKTSDVFGLPRSQFVNDLPARADQFADELREAQAAGAPEGVNWAAIEGEVIGTLPSTSLRVARGAAAIPALLNRGAQGALAGGQVAPTNEMSAGANVGLGAGINALLPPALSRVISPAADNAVNELARRGVRLTPGQILGPTAKRVEDAARSVPILGDAITAAQRRSFGSFNEAVINDALAPINQKIPSGLSGREAVAAAQDAVSGAYENLLPQLRVAADDQFGREILGAREVAKSLPPNLRPTFEHIVDSEVLSKFTPDGLMSGATMKDVESSLGQIAGSYLKSDNVFERRVGDGVRELQRILRSTVERSNPQHAGQLQAINATYARMARVNEAASRTTSESGVFTPEAFSAAVRKGDKSRGHSKYARGDALSQRLSDNARSVMGNRVPDSGTARRLMTGGAPLAAATFLEPTALTATALGAGAYLPGIDAVIRNALLRRPRGALEVANALRNRGNALVPFALAPGSAGAE